MRITYWFKSLPESIRAILLSAAAFVLMGFAGVDYAHVTDWRAFLVPIGIGVIHIVVAGLLGIITKLQSDSPQSQ